MRMRQQERTAQRRQQGKDAHRSMRRDAPGANAPLEKREGNDEHHEQPMLRDFGIFQALDEAALTHRPDLWIRAKEQQRGKQQKEQRPMLCPRRMSAALREG